MVKSHPKSKHILGGRLRAFARRRVWQLMLLLSLLGCLRFKIFVMFLRFLHHLNFFFLLKNRLDWLPFMILKYCLIWLCNLGLYVCPVSSGLSAIGMNKSLKLIYVHPIHFVSFFSSCVLLIIFGWDRLILFTMLCFGGSCFENLLRVHVDALNLLLSCLLIYNWQ